MMTLLRFGVFALVLALGSPSLQASDWLRFRGPNGSGVSLDSESAPLRWSPKQNTKWKVALPGPGVSSPIVVGNRVFVTCYSGYGLDRNNPGDINELKRHLVCIDAETGAIVWERSVDAAQPEDPFEGAGVPAHGYASHTPVSDGERVYVFFGKSGALAFDMQGNQLWQTGVGMESDPSRWGSSSSPVLYNDLLIVTASAESQAMVGLDTKTGEEVWRQEAAGLDSTWGTPTLVETDGGGTELVLIVAGEVWGLNPENGKLRWFCQAGEAQQSPTSAVASDHVVYAVGGRGGGSVAVQPGGKGDVTESEVLWTGRDTAGFGSPLIYEGRLYNVSGGILACIDVETGQQILQARIEGAGGGGFGSADYASPVIADGKLYYQRGSGEVLVFKLGDELVQVAANRTGEASESFGGTPAISKGRLFLRSNKHLYCVVTGDFDESAEPEPPAREGNQSRGAGAGRGGQREGRGGGRGNQRRFDPTEFFNQMDANDDGKLNRDELIGPMQSRFEELDKNSDGSLSSEEFQSGMQNAFSGGSRGGRARGGRGRGGFGGGREDNRPERPRRPQFDNDIGDSG